MFFFPLKIHVKLSQRHTHTFITMKPPTNVPSFSPVSILCTLNLLRARGWFRVAAEKSSVGFIYCPKVAPIPLIPTHPSSLSGQTVHALEAGVSSSQLEQTPTSRGEGTASLNLATYCQTTASAFSGCPPLTFL